MNTAASGPAPLEIHRSRVLPEWIDYNGHLNVAYYVLAFDEALDVFLDSIGLDAAQRDASGQSIFALEMHLTYLREVTEGEPLRFTLQLLDYDAKRLHYLLRMFHGTEGVHLASCESICSYVDMTARRTAEMPPELLARIRDLAQAHAALSWPDEVGHRIAVPRRASGQAPRGPR